METRMKKGGDFRRSRCPIAGTLDVVGDKWSLLVIRDMLHGKRTYGEFLGSPEAIPTNILADRLKRLEDAGIIISSAYQERPVRYAYVLSEKGKALGEVLLTLVKWGKKYIPGTRTLTETSVSAARRGRVRRPARTRARAERAG
jgi:DNA-binding HxlR family transcriptional regulator